MSNTAWIVVGGVAVVGLYLLYAGKVKQGQLEAATHPANALNTLAGQSTDLVRAIGEAFNGGETYA